MTQNVAAWAQIYHDPTNAILKIDFVFFMQQDKTDEFSALDTTDTMFQDFSSVAFSFMSKAITKPRHFFKLAGWSKAE